MDDRPIGLLDSGVGGFTVLKEIRALLPNENIVYLGDSQHMPYGERSNEEIISLVNADIRFLEQRDVKLIIIACNTASSLIDSLRSNVKLFSIVEAGCLAVLDVQKAGPIGLIATRAAVKNRAYEREMKHFSDDLRFISYGTPTLAAVINNHLDELALLRKNIRLAIDPILHECRINNLILGCTHFPIVKKTIKQMYPELYLINPAEKQAELTSAYLTEHNLAGKAGETTADIYITGSEEDMAISNRLLDELDIDYTALCNCELEL